MNTKEITDTYKKFIDNRHDILLTVDADCPLQKQVYWKHQIACITHLFTHTVWNYIVGEMLKQWCSKEYIENRAFEFGKEFRELMIEYTKLDMHNVLDMYDK